MKKQLRNVLITGGGGGLGRAIVKRFLREGDSRLFVVDISQEALNLLPTSEKLTPILNNLSSIEKCNSIVESIVGGVDVFIHLAGAIEKDMVVNENPELWDRVIDANLKTAYVMTGEVLKRLSENGHINFLYFSGIAYRRGAYENIAYSVAKAGIVGLTRSVAKRLGPRGVANALSPGVIMTEPVPNLKSENNVSVMMNEYLARHETRILSQIPMKRFGRVDEVADAAAYFCSPQCSYITGQTINIDGGIINS